MKRQKLNPDKQVSFLLFFGQDVFKLIFEFSCANLSNFGRWCLVCQEWRKMGYIFLEHLDTIPLPILGCSSLIQRLPNLKSIFVVIQQSSFDYKHHTLAPFAQILDTSTTLTHVTIHNDSLANYYEWSEVLQSITKLQSLKMTSCTSKDVTAPMQLKTLLLDSSYFSLISDLNVMHFGNLEYISWGCWNSDSFSHLRHLTRLSGLEIKAGYMDEILEIPSCIPLKYLRLDCGHLEIDISRLTTFTLLTELSLINLKDWNVTDSLFKKSTALQKLSLKDDTYDIHINLDGQTNLTSFKVLTRADKKTTLFKSIESLETTWKKLKHLDYGTKILDSGILYNLQQCPCLEFLEAGGFFACFMEQLPLVTTLRKLKLNHTKNRYMDMEVHFKPLVTITYLQKLPLIESVSFSNFDISIIELQQELKLTKPWVLVTTHLFDCYSCK